MCGIVGLACFNGEVESGIFDRMRDCLSHRGPDGFGSKTLFERRIALGHRRLSIIDTSPKGAQPLRNENGTIWITFNGEIYNYKILREQLLKCGHLFSSNTDTEVLVHGYEEWGIDGLLARIKGMFAFGLWDENKRQLIVARDRVGIKPLYYYLDKDKFIFASEIKGIIANPTVSRNIDFSAVYDFFVYRFIPCPKSIWKDVSKIPPASYLVLNFQTKSTLVKTYWTIPVANEKHDQAYFQKKFEDLLANSVFEHMVSDVPVGLFLSGGYDSSALAHYLNILGYKVNSFSLGFQDWEESEHEIARVVSNHTGTIHHEKILTDADASSIQELSYFYDEPLGGSSFLPTYWISHFARSNGNKVVLAGDGGDELLGGYKWHNRIYSELSKRKWWHRLKEDDLSYLLRRYFQEMSWTGLTYEQVNRIFQALPPSELPDDLWLYREIVRPDVPNLKNLQLLDYKTFMPEVILNKVDRASMANSLEVRVPFLDHELIEFVMTSDTSNYYSGELYKAPIRKVINGVLPAAVVEKKKKGFGAPVRNYNRTVRDKIQASYKDVPEYLFPLGLLNLNDGQKQWASLIFLNWLREWT